MILIIYMEDYIIYILSPTCAAIGFIIRFIWEFYINRRKRELTEKIQLIEFRLKEFYYPIFFYLYREQIIWSKILKLHSESDIKLIANAYKSQPVIYNKLTSIRTSNISNTYSIQKKSIDFDNINKINKLNTTYDTNVTYNINDTTNDTTNDIDINYTNNTNTNDTDTNDINTNDTNTNDTDTNDINTNDTNTNDTDKRRMDIIKALDEENLKIHKAVQSIIHDKISSALPPNNLVQLLLEYDQHVTVYQILREMGIYDRFPIQYDAPYPVKIRDCIEERIQELKSQHQKYSKQLG